MNNSTIKECICDSEKCRSCPYEALSGNLCAECNTDYYRIENDPLNLGIYFNCYKEPVGYFLDKEDFVYKKCFHTCETCEVKGDYLTNNCIKCNSNYSYQIKKKNYTNCYENCSYYHYFDNESYYHCTINNTCPEEYPKLIEENLECMKDDDINIFNSTEIIIGVGSSSFLITSDIYNESYQSSNMIEKQMTSDLENFKSLGSSNEILYDNDISTSLTELKTNVQNEDIKKIIQDMLEKVTTEKNEEEQRKYYDKLIELIKKYFTSENYDFSILNNNEDEMIESEKMNIIFTTLNNQKNNKNINNITLDLEECENLLKDFYNITNNETLYIQLLVISQAGMKIPKLLYYVYGSISGTNLERLNLSVCKNSKISLYIPVNITESLDILNSSSDYYKDICYPAESEDGTDINLKDRKNEFIEKNKTVCQEDCAFSEYDYNKNKAKCSCEVKEFSSLIEDININKTKILENFAYIENIANVHIIVCYKSLFTKNGIINNIGSFLIILIIIFHIISLFIFFIKHLPIIKSKIKGIIFGIRHSKLIKEDKKVNDEQDKKSNKEIIIEKENNNIDNNNKIRNFKKPKKKRKKRRMKKDININDDNQIKNNNIVNIIDNDKINIPNNNSPEKSINKNNIVKSK